MYRRVMNESAEGAVAYSAPLPVVPPIAETVWDVNILHFFGRLFEEGFGEGKRLVFRILPFLQSTVFKKKFEACDFFSAVE